MGPWERWWKRSGWALALRIAGLIAIWVFVLVIGTRVIGGVWPPRGFSGSSTGSFFVLYRLPDGTTHVQTATLPETDEEMFMLRNYEHVQLNIVVGVHDVGGGPSSTGTRYDIEFSYDGGPPGPITQSDRDVVLGAIQRVQPSWVPTPLLNSNGATVIVPYPIGVTYNLMRGLLGLLSFLVVVALLVLVCVRYKPRPSYPACPKCFYSLVGLAGGVCPECGHDRGAVA